MRRSLAEFEAALREETVEERQRAERLRRDTAVRSRARRRDRVRKAGTLRFLLLIATIIGTTIVVTVIMFQVLSAAIG
jgi:membrane glycosyltransferase